MTGFWSRLTFPRLSFDWPASGGGHFLLYTLYTAVLFVIFLVANFPHHMLVRRALDAVDLEPLRLEVRETRFAWWNGYELRGVRLTERNGGAEAPPLLESRSVYVRPGLAGLLRGELSALRLASTMYNGAVDAGWASSDGKSRVAIRFDALELGRYPLFAELIPEGDAGGQLSGAVTLEARGRDIATAQAAGEIQLANARMIGASVRGIAVPDLHSCSGEAKLSLRSGRLEVQQLDAVCEELKLSVSGQIVLRDRIESSVLNLRLEAEPGLAAGDDIKGLLQLIPRSVSGTLASPRWQLGAPSRGRKRR